jgi:uncharacterized protein (TIGR02246 family)
MQTATGFVLLSTLSLVALPAVVRAQAAPSKPAAATGGASCAKSGGAKPAAAGKGAAAASAEEVLRQAIAAYGKALAQGDLQAMAKFWTPDGDYVDPAGRSVKARQALETGDAQEAASRLVLETKSLRMITPEVALEDGVCEMKLEGEKPIYRGHYSAVWVKQQGSWLLSSLRESLAPPFHGERLGALEWLVGEWEADHDGATITVKGNWSDNKMYLLREVVVERGERVIHSVTQRIAWDPLTKRLKGWTFDADGSLGESFWTRQGDTWVVQSTGVTRDGRTTSAKNVYSGIAADSFTLRSLDAQVGKESKPEYELHFKRLPADQ